MRILPALVLFAAAPAYAGTLGTINFYGTVLTHNGVPVAPVPWSVEGSITLNDQGYPTQPPPIPDDYTGTVRFTDAFADPGDAGFSYAIAGAFGGDFTDSNPYHFATVVLNAGALVSFSLVTDGDGDTFTLTQNSFDHELDGGGSDFGTWRLDASTIPEPATWGLLLAGMAATGIAQRRTRSAEA
ncbi:MAG: PEP-CTERM sorting domain-containing protein [Sphingomonadaceae bacterium]|nr:PEP-CTERM sorting domain-containing protein [Sphingomonadaceae bacterium]